METVSLNQGKTAEDLPVDTDNMAHGSNGDDSSCGNFNFDSIC